MNILIIRLSSFGDILLTTPLVRVLRKKYQNAKITYLTRKPFTAIFKNNPNIDLVIPYENSKHSQIKQELQNNNYNIIIDLQNNLRSKRLIFGLNCKKYKYQKDNLRKFLLVKYKINLFNEKILSVAEKYIKSVENLKPDSKSLEFYPDKIEQKEDKTKKCIGICPGSKHFTKSWPIEYYVEISKILINKGYDVIVLGGKDDEAVAKEILNKVPQIIWGITNNNLNELYWNMHNCDLIICNDSGLMHFACTLPNKKIIAIFGPTVKEFGFSPYNNPNAIVLENNNIKCRPCTHIGNKKCPKIHFKCMKDIQPSYVLKKIEEMINGNSMENNL
ncbi:MAG TPA: glycosyltransferase family 9 protein [Ignavibacteriales bacterium]|nr:glycosyltransferase family 9 protein [Ignavibacteriales bacterium]